VPQQRVAETQALLVRTNCNVFDEQMIRSKYHLHQPEELTVSFAEINDMLRDCAFVVRDHGLGFATDERHPFRVGGTRQRPHGGSVGRCRSPEGEIRQRRHLGN
jgi:hypothetical protein